MSDADLITALRLAVARADPSWVNQPSHLRRRLEEELGAGARGWRAQIHQLVVAAEERIPIRLRRNGWSLEERDDLAHVLIAGRGWTAEASLWAVTTWAVALGLIDVPLPTSASPQPFAPIQAAVPGPFAVASDRPQPTDLPSESWLATNESIDNRVPTDKPTGSAQTGAFAPPSGSPGTVPGRISMPPPRPNIPNAPGATP